MAPRRKQHEILVPSAADLAAQNQDVGDPGRYDKSGNWSPTSTTVKKAAPVPQIKHTATPGPNGFTETEKTGVKAATQLASATTSAPAGTNSFLAAIEQAARGSSNSESALGLSSTDANDLVYLVPPGGTGQGLFYKAPTGKITLETAMSWLVGAVSGDPTKIEELQAQLVQGGLLNPTSFVVGSLGKATISALRYSMEAVSATVGAQNPESVDSFISYSASVGTYTAAEDKIAKALQAAPGVTAVPIANTNDLINAYDQAYRNVNGMAPPDGQAEAFATQYQQQQMQNVSPKVQAEEQSRSDKLLGSTNTANLLGTLSDMSLDDFTQAFQQIAQHNPGHEYTKTSNVQKISPHSGVGPVSMPQTTTTTVGAMHIDPQQWRDGLELLEKVHQITVSQARQTNQMTASPEVQMLVLKAVAAADYQRLGDWTEVTSMLLTGTEQARLDATDRAWVGQTAAEMSKLQTSQFNASLVGTGVSLNAQGVPTVTPISYPEYASSVQGEAVASAQAADPALADANAIGNVYDEMASRMFRPGGYSSPADVNMNSGVASPGGTVGLMGPTTGYVNTGPNSEQVV